MRKRGQRFLRRLGASALNGEFCSRLAHVLRIDRALGNVRYSTIGIGEWILTAGFLRVKILTAKDAKNFRAGRKEDRIRTRDVRKEGRISGVKGAKRTGAGGSPEAGI